MPAEKKIRLAIVRCDTHAYWYGAFMDEVDPLIMATYSSDAPTREAVHNYFKAVGNPRALKIERVPGFVISKVYDRIPEKGLDERGLPKLQYGTYPGRAKTFSVMIAPARSAPNWIPATVMTGRSALRSPCFKITTGGDSPLERAVCM